MSVKTNQYASPTSQDLGRGPSQSIWADCPLEDFIQSFGGGIGTAGQLVQDDFCPVATPSALAAAADLGQWACWAATGSTVLDGIEEGGVAKINGTTTGKAFILTSNAGLFRFIGPSTAFSLVGGKFWMEFRLAVGSVAASQQAWFVGVADNTGSQINSVDTTIITAAGTGLTTTKNLMGFFQTTTTGTPTGLNQADVSFVYQPAAGTAVYPTNMQTLVNAVTGANMSAYAASSPIGKGTGFVKIGMVFDPSPANPSLPAPASPPAGQTAGNLYRPIIKVFVNGQLHAYFLSPNILQATTFPVNAIFSPVFSYMNVAGATAPIYLDWMRFAQLASF